MSKDKITLAQALHEAQASMSGAKPDKTNSFFKQDYSSLASVIEAVKEAFYENGIAVTNTMDVLEGGQMVIKTTLLHINGETLESKMLLPENKNPQEVGKNVTYYRRYMLLGLAGIPGQDDDSESFATQFREEKKKKEVITDEKWKTLDDYLNGDETLRKELMKLCATNDLKSINNKQLLTCGEYARKYKERLKNEKNGA